MKSIWNPPENGRIVSTFDTHTAGEPLRIITGRHEFVIDPRTRCPGVFSCADRIFPFSRPV